MIDVSVESVKDDYLKLITENEYISFRMYNEFLEKYSDLFINQSDNDIIKYISNKGYSEIENHNDRVIDKELVNYKEYFDNMFNSIDDKIILDDEQRKAILNKEDYSLIIAGAGAGKTTTMAAKVKYLIEKCNVDPRKIAVISFTNKATEELEDRIKFEFGLPVDVMTFHSLGIKIVRRMFDNPLKPLSNNEQREIIINFVKDYLFKNKSLLKKYVEVFKNFRFDGNPMFSKGFLENYLKFDSFADYFNDYKARKQAQDKDKLAEIIQNKTTHYIRQTTPRSIKNEQMRSRAEARIANFLFVNGIDYKYEEVYPEKVDYELTYLPDFTLEVNGEPIYIEYFGLSGFYENGSISEKNQKKYNYLREKKYQFHKLKNNKYIELDYKKEKDGVTIDYLSDLENKLKAYGVRFNKISNEEIYNQFLDNNMSAEFYNFVDFFIDVIDKLKATDAREHFVDLLSKYISNIPDGEDIKESRKLEANLFIHVYKYYQNELMPKHRVDFSDMIYYANKYIKTIPSVKNVLEYEYLIIDEYQDISIDRYLFARNISMISNAKVISVGDDWQTIFSFAGSRIDLFFKYNMLFPGARQLFINNTYRNSQELIDKAGSFVMKNPFQIKKQLFSNKVREDPIKVVFYEDNQFERVSKILDFIYSKDNCSNVLILARRNKIIDRLIDSEFFSQGVDTRIIYNKYPNLIIDAMSIHSAKGLGADYVIILNVTNNDFPLHERIDNWLVELFKPHGFYENFSDAEERRVFYVALTRAKKDVYLLSPLSSNKRSPFLNELDVF